LELARLEDAVSRLERSQRGHAREQAAAVARRDQLERRAARLAIEQEELGPFAAAVAAAATRGHPWRVQIGGATYENRAEAARALAPLLGYGQSRVLLFPDAGIDVEWRMQYGIGELAALVGTRHATITVEDRRHDGLVGSLTRLSNAVDALPRRLEELRSEAADVTLQIEQTRGAGREPFAHADDLHDARRRAGTLRRELADRYGDERRPAMEQAKTAGDPGVAELADRRHVKMPRGQAADPSYDPTPDAAGPPGPSGSCRPLDVSLALGADDGTRAPAEAQHEPSTIQTDSVLLENRPWQLEASGPELFHG
jgi:hypothetical protein